MLNIIKEWNLCVNFERTRSLYSYNASSMAATIGSTSTLASLSFRDVARLEELDDIPPDVINRAVAAALLTEDQVGFGYYCNAAAALRL